MTRPWARAAMWISASCLSAACSGAPVRPAEGPCHNADAATWLEKASHSITLLPYHPGPLYDIDARGRAVATRLGALPADSEAVLSFPDQGRFDGADGGFANVRDRSFVYDDALVALWLTHQGDGHGARRVLQTLAALQRNDGAWGFSFAARTDGFYNASYVRAGTVAWALYAFARYADAFHDHRFSPKIERATVWLLHQRDPGCGLVLAGSGKWRDAEHYDPAYVADFAATEHQIDAWFALRAVALADPGIEARLHVAQAAVDLEGAIERELWLEGLGRYAQGLRTEGPDLGSALDAAGTWAAIYAAAVQRSEHADLGLDWVRRTHAITVNGWPGWRPYADLAPETWFVEGSLALPLALHRLGRGDEARKALQPMVDLACTAGVPLVYSPVWAEDFPLSPAVAPTVWFLLAGAEVARGEPPFLWRERLRAPPP